MLREDAPRGNWATLLLPINEDDSIDESLLADQVDRFAGFGVDGVYSNGTAGEFYNQTDAEFLAVQRVLADRCHHHGLPFQIGASHPFPVVTLQRIRECKPLRPSAFQVILPDWFPPRFAEVTEFLRGVAELADPIPIVLYNPPHAKVRLGPGELLQLTKEVPGLIGVKVPGGDAEWYRQMEPVLERLSVFVPGHTLATGASQGAHGAYSNVACLHPGVAQQWWQSICDRDPEAFRLEERIQQFMREAIVPYIAEQGYANQAVDKLMAVVGAWSFITPRLRWPYRWLGKDAVLATRAAAQRIIPEFIAERSSAWRPPSPVAS